MLYNISYVSIGQVLDAGLYNHMQLFSRDCGKHVEILKVFTHARIQSSIASRHAVAGGKDNGIN